MTRQRRDPGFTLIEVVVTVALIALVAVALGAAFTVIIRTTPTAEDRIDDSASMLSLTSWLPRDVNSADLSLFDPAPYTNGCSGVSGGDLLQLEWSDGSADYTVDYRFVDGAPDLGTIVRYSCVNGLTATAIELTAPLRRIGGLPPVTVTTLSGGAGTDGIGVAVEVLDQGGIPRTLVDLDLYSTNLPSPLTSTTLPGVTTSSGVNQPPHAADIWVTVPPGGDIFVTLPGTDIDGPTPDLVPPISPLDGEIFITPNSGLLVFVDVPDPGALPRSDVPFTYEVIDDDGATATGTIFVTIGGTTTATSTTTSTIAPVPCWADLSVSPAIVSLDDDGSLDSDVTVTINRSGFCHPLVVAFDPDTTDDDQTPVELRVDGYATVTIGRDDHVWRQSGTGPWTVPIQLREGSNGPSWDTENLTVAP